MKGQALLVEFGRLDGSGGPLNAEADEGGGRDLPCAHRTGTSVDVGTVIRKRRLAVPVAMQGEVHFRVQLLEQAIGVAGAFLLHEKRLTRVNAKETQDRAPRHRLAAEAAKMAGLEVPIASSCHPLPSAFPPTHC